MLYDENLLAFTQRDNVICRYKEFDKNTIILLEKCVIMVINQNTSVIYFLMCIEQVSYRSENQFIDMEFLRGNIFEIFI